MASIAVIEEQGKHMSELVQQLLGLTRMQHGTDRYPMRRSDLSIFVESCCGEFMPHDSRGISLETDIKPGIEADFNPALMSRVVQNLLQNAYKYGRENGHILVSLEQRGGRALLRVRDDGIGIAPGGSGQNLAALLAGGCLPGGGWRKRPGPCHGEGDCRVSRRQGKR